MSAKRRSLAIAATMLGSAALAACSSDDNDSSPPPTAPIVSSPTTSADGADTTGPAPSAAPSTDAATSTAASTSPATAPTTAAPTVGPTSPTPVDPNQLAFPAIAEVSHPVDLTYRAGDPAFYIVSRDGFIVALRDGALDDTRLLDISNSITAGGEQGLLGLTFSVDGQHAYVNYTNGSGDTEITEYAVDGDGVFDPASKRVLLTIDQPYSNHNGGQVRIGPDGYLYIGMGDGGSGGDPERRALNVAELLGKMLRIDPNPAGDSPYGIPADNPFIGVQGARTEIWSVGLRNPWRYTFDRANNDLWIADVGQGEWEEIDVAPAATGGGRGANFGWSAFEGTHRFNEDQSGDGAIPPVHEYEHGSAGCSVSGGVRYRGAAIPDLYGWYVYGDYCSSQVRALEIADDYTAGREVVLSSSINSLSEIAEGPDGELFALSVDDDTVYAIQPAG